MVPDVLYLRRWPPYRDVRTSSDVESSQRPIRRSSSDVSGPGVSKNRLALIVRVVSTIPHTDNLDMNIAAKRLCGLLLSTHTMTYKPIHIMDPASTGVDLKTDSYQDLPSAAKRLLCGLGHDHHLHPSESI